MINKIKHIFPSNLLIKTFKNQLKMRAKNKYTRKKLK